MMAFGPNEEGFIRILVSTQSAPMTPTCVTLG
jgi:hypothetical protein